MVWGVVGGSEGLSREHAQALDEVAEWMYRKSLGLSYTQFLEEPMMKFQYGLQIEDSIRRLEQSNNKT